MPTRFSRSAPDHPPPLFADASVLINLNATGCAGAILDHLPFRIMVAQDVENELAEDRRSGRDDAAMLRDLAVAERLMIVPLDAAATDVFADLIAGPAADTLDDGEAATIALAATQGAIAAIDERKARRICVLRFPALRVLSSCDLLLHDDVARGLGRDALGDAVFRTLRTARMRVLADHLDAILRLIGPGRAALCPSLPKSVRGA